MSTYSISRDGIADLALPVELDAATADASPEQQDEIEDRVNAKLAESGWDGDWSAEAIVRDVLGL